jgi:glutaconate CoA-transferase subunit A
MTKCLSLSEAARLIPDGATVAIGGAGLRRKPIRLVLELIRQQRRKLQLWTFVGSLDADMLIGAGCVEQIHYSYVGFEHHGLAPHFSRAAESEQIKACEYTEWMFIYGVRAAVMGLPFLPTHAGRGSDLARDRGMQHITCPYSGEQLLAVPRTCFDFAILHAWRGDERGCVQAIDFPDHLIEVDYLLARAARQVIVTVEELVSSEEIERTACRTVLFPFEVTAIVPTRRGAAPTAFPPLYPCQAHAIEEYLKEAKAAAGEAYQNRFSCFLDRWTEHAQQ